MQWLLLFVVFLSISGWELRRKSEPKAKEHKFSRWIGTGNLNHLPKLNRVPQLSKSKSLQVPEKSPFNPCASSDSICLNGGKCLNKDGSYLCHCPPTHYGKKCEILADTKKCAGNKCQNGATCISRPNAIQIIDPELEAIYTRTKKPTEPLPLHELQKMMTTVSYECICRSGFVGPLCEMTEEELRCKEDYCRGRGTASFSKGSCTCNCHHNYLGLRCETSNPCKDYECHNSGICKPQLNQQTRMVEAVCQCPQIQLIKAKVTGEQCEAVTVDDADSRDQFMPCQPGVSLAKWYVTAASAVQREGYNDVYKALNRINDGCRHNDGQKCDVTHMFQHHCFNLGECEPRVVSFPESSAPGEAVALLIPFCSCRGADTGRFCEFKRDDECDPTPEEKEAGITKASRCTDEDHGTCVAVVGEPKCLCKPGYVGEMCETYDPCAGNPCWNSECIPIPSETIVNSVGQHNETYRCLCEMGDEQIGVNKCVFRSTGNCTSPDQCHQGQCVTCEHSDEEDMLQLCDDKQMSDGFRCICKPGYNLPYCERLADPCEENLCENGANCLPVGNFDYTCQCAPGTKGSLCEEITDICLAFGNLVCQYGDCYEDRATVRGFSCDCLDGYIGRDCQLAQTFLQLFWMFFMDNYWYTWPALLLPLNILLICLLYFCCRRPDLKRSLSEMKKSELSEVTGREEGPGGPWTKSKPAAQITTSTEPRVSAEMRISVETKKTTTEPRSESMGRAEQQKALYVTL